MQHKNLNAIDGYTTTAPSSTVLTVPANKPITVVESSYDTTTKRWYRKYSDGWIEQGGYYEVTGSWSSYAKFTVTFGSDYNFTSTPVMIHCMQVTTAPSASGPIQGLYGVSDVSSTGFTYCTGYTGNDKSVGFYWTAKGM